MSGAPSLGEEPFPPTTAWRGPMRGLLEHAIARHGGWDAWRKAVGASLVPVSVTGVLPATKGLGRTFPLPSRIDVWPRDAAAIFHEYPSPGCSGMFAAGAVEIVRPDGAVVAAVADARATFRGWAKHRRWSPVDGLYFFGYALTHYQGLPFTLVDARPLTARGALVGRRRVRGVEVELPPRVHTHSRRQTFYFDDDGLLCRHDYVAEVVGRWAHGAHFWEDFATVDGLEVARRRRIVARLGSFATTVVVLDARFASVSPVHATPDVVWPGAHPVPGGASPSAPRGDGAG